MLDEILPEDLEGVVDAPSDDEGDEDYDQQEDNFKMQQEQDRREQEELISNVQNGWANAGKRNNGRRRGDVGYMMEGSNNRHRKRLRLDDDENDEDEDLNGLDEEDMLARRAERDAIRRGSDLDDDDDYGYSDEEGEEGKYFKAFQSEESEHRVYGKAL